MSLYERQMRGDHPRRYVVSGVYQGRAADALREQWTPSTGRNTVKSLVAPHLKAVVSALVTATIAFLSSLLTALQGENSGFGTITAGQWVTAALAFLIGLGVAGGVTHQVPNRAATPLAPTPAPAAADATAPA
jgi:hypothetical protein